VAGGNSPWQLANMLDSSSPNLVAFDHNISSRTPSFHSLESEEDGFFVNDCLPPIHFF
jgi:hypothetical protein